MRFTRGERLLPDSPPPALRLSEGFTAHEASREVTVEAIIEHIIDGTKHSPFISITTDKRIAQRYAPAPGSIYYLEVHDQAQVINPVSAINEWLVANGKRDGEDYLRAQEAIRRAEEDSEWLIVRHLPSATILTVEPAQSGIW